MPADRRQGFGGPADDLLAGGIDPRARGRATAARSGCDRGRFVDQRPLGEVLGLAVVDCEGLRDLVPGDPPGLVATAGGPAALECSLA